MSEKEEEIDVKGRGYSSNSEERVCIKRTGCSRWYVVRPKEQLQTDRGYMYQDPLTKVCVLRPVKSKRHRIVATCIRTLSRRSVFCHQWKANVTGSWLHVSGPSHEGLCSATSEKQTSQDRGYMYQDPLTKVCVLPPVKSKRHRIVATCIRTISRRSVFCHQWKANVTSSQDLATCIRTISREKQTSLDRGYMQDHLTKVCVLRPVKSKRHRIVATCIRTISRRSVFCHQWKANVTGSWLHVSGPSHEGLCSATSEKQTSQDRGYMYQDPLTKVCVLRPVKSKRHRIVATCIRTLSRRSVFATSEKQTSQDRGYMYQDPLTKVCVLRPVKSKRHRIVATCIRTISRRSVFCHQWKANVTGSWLHVSGPSHEGLCSATSEKQTSQDRGYMYQDHLTKVCVLPPVKSKRHRIVATCIRTISRRSVFCDQWKANVTGSWLHVSGPSHEGLCSATSEKQTSQDRGYMYQDHLTKVCVLPPVKSKRHRIVATCIRTISRRSVFCHQWKANVTGSWLHVSGPSHEGLCSATSEKQTFYRSCSTAHGYLSPSWCSGSASERQRHRVYSPRHLGN